MTTQFDPLKAAREELAGMQDILTTLRQRENEAEAAMGKAERELNAVRKLRGFALIWIERKRTEIAQIEAEQQQ